MSKRKKTVRRPKEKTPCPKCAPRGVFQLDPKTYRMLWIPKKQ
ncbi:hypothetical protein ES703_64710 [subsurface metagenome]